MHTVSSDPARVDDLVAARLRRLLGGPETGWLRARVRRRLERAEPGVDRAPVPR